MISVIRFLMECQGLSVGMRYVDSVGMMKSIMVMSGLLIV